MEVSVDISAPPDAVFARVCDLDWYERKVSDIRLVVRVQEPADGTRFGPGLAWLETREMFGQEGTVRMEVRAVDAARREYTAFSVSNGMAALFIMRVEPAPGGCTLYHSTPVEPPDLVGRVVAWLLTPLFAVIFRGGMRRDLEDIKRAIEGEGAAAAAS